ncbi:RagB/SusD family nutrient uptake outer membrane protein [Sphingobacterium alkalisoli]|uniref:RagB/SusD family nutrient uptake outer membrane protein n=1 Tax=Sphingobacterium alkalisoli TaxID=1874115 RepID=A0A4V5LXQ6_9SPHI|nr:RagB/SusD family nutrient uptake outer membrane protein [Sphingobacterium alkalisoli]TJY63519.1 RagB/SusD family nutrient uptake outer membrane protein [Sphingobacterium alkalisoli]GGH26590.1 starch-binding protein [Sphingobacterium alkalisoli]
MIRNIYIILASIVVLGISSCNDFLDLKPMSYPTDENFWQTEDDANSGVAAVYALIRQTLNYSGGMTYYAYGDFPSDEFTTSGGAPWMFNHVIDMNWSEPVASSDTGNPLLRLRRYDVFYRAIDQANRVLKYVPEMPVSAFSSEQVRNRLIGEAYFCRAFLYFYMSRIWGGVPLVTETVPVDEAQDIAATESEEILDQCLRDVTSAKPLLSWERGSSSSRAIRANKTALFALEAHIHAWNQDYALCAEAADSVLTHGGLEYVGRGTAYKSIFVGQSNEGIFEISQNATNEGTISGIGMNTLVEPYLRGRTGNPGLIISPTHIESLYQEDDLRLRNAFDLEASETSVVCTKYSNVTYTDETANALAIFKNNIVIFRYSDIKLLHAEALAATEREASAISILNEVRDQAGIGVWDQDGDLFEEIIAERGRELFLEGHRFYDMIRLGRFKGKLLFGSKMTSAQFNSGKYYWPFDPSLLSVNRRLIQTPFWSTVNM